MPHPPLAITACELLTPLDSPTTTTWHALTPPQSQRIGKNTAINNTLLSPNDPSLDRSIQLALTVARRAAARTTITPDTALFCATSKGPVSTFLAAADTLRNHQPLTRAQAEHIALGVGAMAPLLAQHLNLHGPTHTSVAACASGLHALHRAARALQHNECQQALIVAADASLHPLFEASFQRLGVLSPLQPDGTRHCHPFSESGEGFFLTEAAAAIMLHRTDDPSAPPALAYLEDSWIGNDASALIAIDPHTRSLRHGLSSIAHSPPPAFIHAHATGTTHDAFERAAIRHIIGKDVPVFSCKEFLGHSLGAAGLVSVALSALCHVNLTTLQGERIPQAAESLTIAQGFGGHIGIVRLRGR